MPDSDRFHSRSNSPSNANHNDDLAFPVFPKDFEPDTLYLHQALAEHNYERLASGLSAKNYFQLSDEERHDVLARASKLKLAVHPPEVIRLPIPKTNERQVNEDAKDFAGSLGFYLLILGVMGLTALLWRIL